MTTRIVIEMDNAAFEDRPVDELIRIVRKLAVDLDQGRVSLADGPTLLHDHNGNCVGSFTVED